MRDDVVVSWDVVHVGVIYESKRSYVFEVPHVDFIMPCGVVVFSLVLLPLGLVLCWVLFWLSAV